MIEPLKEYPWETRYSSGTHDLAKDFFVPALSRSRFYYRIAGYFTSTSLAAAFRGISAFVENGEKMYLIVGSDLTREDVDAITRGMVGLSEVLHKKWSDCIKDMGNDVVRRRFELLAWLVANGKIEIRIGVNKDSAGRYLPSSASVFHEKVLIFEDFDGNRIQLDGSVNETWKAWRSNRESFCVHKSWVEGNEEFIESAKAEFDRLWGNLDDSCETMEIPVAIRKDLIRYLPERQPQATDEVDFSNEELDIEPRKAERPLRRYQEEAIEAWKANNHIGILEMATGTGKTFTALRAIRTLPCESKILLICVPQTELAGQWASECENVFVGIRKRIVLCYGGTGWDASIDRELRQSRREGGLCIVIAVINTLRKPLLKGRIEKDIDNTYLLVDEVHEIGSPENRRILSSFNGVKHRLGLSATPNRAWDEEGNQAIADYFGEKPVFTWDMEKAIHPPHGYEPCLSPYEYDLHDCHLTEEEVEKYEQLSLRIKKRYAMLTGGGGGGKKSVNSDPSLQLLLFKRAELIKECKDKYRLLEEILDTEGRRLTKCLIYCNDEEHMDKVTRIVERKGFHCRKFFGQMDSDERERVFDSFKTGDVQFIVAIKCLDQGVDLPMCDSAIILASSKNPREFVQRRGRILRLHENKEKAIVHDIIVFPYPIEDLRSGMAWLYDYEARLLESQLQRIDIFAENSVNRAENLLKKLKYGEIIVNATRGVPDGR